MPLQKQFDPHESWRIFRIMAEFVEGFEVMAPIGKGVSVFGSARTKPDDPMYQAAEETARLLVKSKFAVITGGGPGIMEAANKGAFDAGGVSVGLNISLPQEQEGNKYQNVSLDFHYFYARKVMFTKYAEAFIYFPGGYGTLDELFEVLTLVQTLKVDAFPVVLFGSAYWSGLVEWMNKTLRPKFVDLEDIDIFKIVDDPKEAVRIIRKRWWKPLDPDLLIVERAASGKKATGKLPVEGTSATAGDTGEGTRYGKRPRRPGKNHVESKKKPQQ
ncbi:MAG: TIGR00730 family Rossman fold protein [Tepidisphaeraceae bacterium]